MRTLDLIKALSDNEVKEVESLLTGTKRETLLKFFKELKKFTSKDTEPSHEELFKKLFNEPYEKDKDYLLRNRMRQINGILYEYLASDAFKRIIAANPGAYNYWLAKSFFDRRLKSLFESDIDEFLRISKEKITINETTFPTDCLNLYGLKSLWMIANQPRVSGNTEAQIAFTDEWLREEKRRFLYRVRELEARKAFLEMQLRKMKNLNEKSAASEGISHIDLSEFERDDWFARHLTLKKKIYQSDGVEKVKALKEALEIGSLPEHRTVLGFNDLVTNLTNLATELILLGEYKQGNNYQTELLKICAEQKHPTPIAAVQNHMVNQLNLGNYEEGLRIYKQYHKEITESRSAKSITLQMCYFYLFLGKEDEAISQLPESSGLTRQHQIHHRYVYLIAFILRGDNKLAQTEAANLKRMIKRTEDGELNDYLVVMNLFEKYLKALDRNKTEKAQALSMLKHKIETQYKKWDLLASTELPLRWLMTRLNVSPTPAAQII